MQAFSACEIVGRGIDFTADVTLLEDAFLGVHTRALTFRYLNASVERIDSEWRANYTRAYLLDNATFSGNRSEFQSTFQSEWIRLEKQESFQLIAAFLKDQS